MKTSSEVFEAIEVVASCLYSLCEGGYEYVDCVPEAVNALIYLSQVLGTKLDLSSILSRSSKPITQMTEDEVSYMISALRMYVNEADIDRSKNVMEEIYSALINATSLVMETSQMAVAIEAT